MPRINRIGEIDMFGRKLTIHFDRKQRGDMLSKMQVRKRKTLRKGGV